MLVFTGGIGEHDAVLRQQAGKSLAYLCVQVNAVCRAKTTSDRVASIHTGNGSIEVWVIPTGEVRVATQDALVFL